MKELDFLLIFPPNTEARLFPYLSLPYLTSYLRSKGYSVIQRDLNIELSIDIFKRNLFQSKQSQSHPKDLKDLYRNEMNSFFQEAAQHIFLTAFEKKESNYFSKEQAVRLARTGLQLMLENSVLNKIIPSLSKTTTFAASYSIEEDNHILVKKLSYKLNSLMARYRPKVIGISVTFYSQLLPTLLICRWFKKHHPETIIILGGRQIMIRYKDIIQLKDFYLFADLLCLDQGEEVLEKVHKALIKEIPEEEVPSVIWIKESTYLFSQQKNKLTIKDLPSPVFDGLPLKSYLNVENQIPLITCVGCYWGRCIFCSYGNHSLMNNNYQQLSAEKVADHCEYLIKSHNIRRINFVDENNNLQLILDSVRELNKRGYKITFSTRNRLEKVLTNLEFCKELADRGCVLMSCGYETNSQRLLDKMDKGIKSKYYQEIIDNLDSCGIALRLSVMGGLFDESQEEFEASKNFLLKNSSKIGIDIMQMLVAEPLTRLSNNPERYAIDIKSKENLRGNERLNYAHGRMGYLYDFQDGIDFFNKEKRFIEIFKEVIPSKNSDLPPEKKPRAITCDYPKGIRLFPWVRVLEKDKSEKYLLDLQYEKIYKFPADLAYNSKTRVVATESIKASRYIKVLLENELGINA